MPADTSLNPANLLSASTVAATLADCFSPSYREARERFLAAAEHLKAPVQSHVHPRLHGANGEELAMDVLRLGKAAAANLVIVSSGVHGIEGFCGSGCQIAMLRDDELLAGIDAGDVAVLMIHAVNPFGFSYLRRVNEDNIDLNRNFIDFSAPLPINNAYDELDALLLPPVWPPSDDNTAAIAAYLAKNGMRAFQNAVGDGQTTHPEGMFYRGKAPSWSNQTLRAIVREHGAGSRTLAWVDLHTGLGRYGHGEKIFSGRDDARALERARACWGADVVSPFAGESVANTVVGPAAACVYDECPQAAAMLLGLEFGTQPLMQVMNALRADHWLANQVDPPEAASVAVGQAIREAFFGGTPEWCAMVVAQARVCVLQALLALPNLDKPPAH